MKKKLLSGIFALALLVATGYGVSQTMKSDSGLSDLALSNVEALANGEVNPLCPNGCVSGNKGCYCYIWYWELQEYNWGN